MINLHRILNNIYVRDAVPQFINDRVPPTSIQRQLLGGYLIIGWKWNNLTLIEVRRI